MNHFPVNQQTYDEAFSAPDAVREGLVVLSTSVPFSFHAEQLLVERKVRRSMTREPISCQQLAYLTSSDLPPLCEERLRNELTHLP